MIKLSKDSFLNLANEKFKFKFNYDKSFYINRDISLIIVCPIHGNFNQSPRNHLLSQFGCNNCKNNLRESNPNRLCTVCNLELGKDRYIRKNKSVVPCHKKCYTQYNVNNRLKFKYNLLPEDVFNKLNDQKYKCNICNITIDNKTSNIDHCHITNNVRGLLCTNCNIGLGHFKDDILVLQNAISYLNKYKNK